MATPDRVERDDELTAHAEFVGGLLDEAGLPVEIVRNDRTAFVFVRLPAGLPAVSLAQQVASVLTELEEDGLVTLRPGILVEIVN